MITCGTERRERHEYTRKGVCVRCGNWFPGTFLRKVQDFWFYVKRGEGCWEWTGHIDIDGYGRFTVEKTLMKAPRVMWMLREGDIPVGMCVCHTCDNRKCIRPDHLFLGTPKDNHQDKVRKGRTGRMAKLTPQQVVEIRKQRTEGVGIPTLSMTFGVGRSQISRIINNQSWASLLTS